MKRKNKRSLALLLAGTLLTGILPIGTGVKSQAVEQNALRNPRIFKTTQEVAPGSAGKKELKNPTIGNGIATWDCIWFGNYWQEDTNGDGKADKNDEKTPIKWRVLSVEGDDVFLLADKNLDVQRYNDNDTSSGATWENCTMRSWLNGYGAENNKDGKDYSDNNFLDYAFSEAEQTAIRTTSVVNNGSWENDTTDKVYLLSEDEIMNPAYGFLSSLETTETRQAMSTAYVADGGEIKSSEISEGLWWLRSPVSGIFPSYVTGGGEVLDRAYANWYSIAARPALHLNLSSVSSWSYAGSVVSDEVIEWDCIWFGNYWQEDVNGDGKADKNDGKTPIKWRVLSVVGNDIFLLADKNLDVQRYNETETETEVPWETCTIRSWLNGYGAEENQEGKDYSDNNFLNNAFSAAEQTAIRTTSVVNNDNQWNDTTDKVYLLSTDEVTNPSYGFSSYSGKYDGSRRAKSTEYTKELGVGTLDYIVEYEENALWWLRSSGDIYGYVSAVYCWGDVDTSVHVDYDYCAVRPVLHLNLSSESGWSYAGTVTLDGGGEEIGGSIPTSSPSPTEPENTQKPQETMKPEKTVEPDVTEKPSLSPLPTESGNTQKPQRTVEPGKTDEPKVTEKPSLSPLPTEPENTQKPQESVKPGGTEKPSITPTAPGTPFQPGTSSVMPSVQQTSSTAVPSSGISSDPGKVMVGKVSALKFKQKNHTVIVSWKKLTGVRGYQICYSTSKKWKSKKQKLITKNNTVIKSLRKNKTYYFRVRAYRLEGTKKVYGAWSATNRITIKR